MKVNKKFNDLSKTERAKHISELENTLNMYDFLMYLNEHFAMVETNPGIITKRILSEKMINLVLPMINPTVIELKEH